MLTFKCIPSQIVFSLDGCDAAPATFTAKLHCGRSVTPLTVTPASSQSPPTVTVSGFPATLSPGRYQIYLLSPHACCCFVIPFILYCPTPYIAGTHHPTQTEPFPVCCPPTPPPGS